MRITVCVGEQKKKKEKKIKSSWLQRGIAGFSQTAGEGFCFPSSQSSINIFSGNSDGLPQPDEPQIWG